MSKDTMVLTRPPGVSLKGLQERKILQARLMGTNSQLQNFASLRDQLAAAGQDADAKYRQMQARRDQLMANLTKLAPAPIRTGAAGVPVGPVKSLPIAPTIFSPPHYTPSFGYTGQVAFGSPTEGIDAVIPEGTQLMSGSISRGTIFEPSVVAYVGNLSVTPIGGLSFEFSLDYTWIHSWNYLILFPPPAGRCLFTYNVGMLVGANVHSHAGQVNLSSFVSFGETPAFDGEDVPTNLDSWPPFSVDLGQPYTVNDSSYNGTSGIIKGPSVFQGSFVVARNRTPAVAVAVGVISSQSAASVLNLEAYPNWSLIYPGVSDVSNPDPSPGNVTFNYTPLPEIETLH